MYFNFESKPKEFAKLKNANRLANEIEIADVKRKLR